MKRAYGSEPVLLDSSPITPNPQPLKTGGNRRWRLMLVVVICVCIFGSAIYFVLNRGAAGTVPTPILQQASFPLYVPAWLPQGMTVRSDSFDATSQVVTFSVDDNRGTRLVFTEQLRPGSQEMSTFYDQQLTEKRTYKTGGGETTVGRFEGTGFAAVVTDKTWILIRAVADIDQKQLEKIADHLRLAQ
ncbi:MAG TPA: DUF4367 domain-containing protein [Candidatus Saccharimonadales bacterium]